MRSHKYRTTDFASSIPFLKLLRACAGVLILFALVSCEEKPKSIDGQIFVVTKGGENIKLALVEISLFDLKTLSNVINEKEKAAVPVQADLDALGKKNDSAWEDARVAEKKAWDAHRADDTNSDLRAKSDEASSATEKAFARWKLSGILESYLMSDFYYFNNLPPPLQTAKSDVDGKFAFHVNAGEYALVANAVQFARKDALETFCWMVEVKVEGGNVSVMLANDNMTSGRSRDSLVFATDVHGVDSAMNGHDLQWLVGYVAQRKHDYQEAETQKKTEDDRKANEARIEKEAGIQKEAQIQKDRDAAAAAQKEKDEHEAQLKLFEKNPKLAQAKAIELYPGLGVAGSALNKEFVARYKKYQLEKKDFFTEADWPVRLAKECSDALADSPAK